MTEARHLIVALMLLLAAGGARANGGFGLAFDSVEAAGQGFAGAEFDSIARNPAALTLASPGIRVGGTLAYYQTGFAGQASRAATDGSAIAGGNGGNPGRLDLPLPDLQIVAGARGRWHYGLALAAPFGITLQFDPDWRGRYHAIDTKIRGVELIPSAAFAVSDALVLGAGLRLHGLRLAFSNDVDLGAVVQRRAEQQAGGVDPVTASCAATAEDTLPGKYDFRNRFEDARLALSWQLGAHWQPVPAWRLALAYRAPIRHQLDGNALRRRDGWTPDAFRSDGCFAALRIGLAAMGRSFEDDVVQPALRASANTGFSAALPLPETASAGLRWHHGRWQLAGTLRVTRWSRIGRIRFDFDNGAQSVTEPVNLRNSTLLGLGVQYALTPTVRLRTGAALETSTVTDATRTARAPDADRRYLTAGLGWQLTRRLGVDVSAGYANGARRPVQDLADASGSGNLLDGEFEPLRLLFGSARLRWRFGSAGAPQRAAQPVATPVRLIPPVTPAS